VVENDRDSPYEGTFQLRLPEGASPYYFAFGENRVQVAGAPELFTAQQAHAMATDPAGILAARAAAWTGPKEARMVGRDKAARAYRDTVRRAVDPALLEWSGPGIFSARVFPLARKSRERIVIGYDVPLAPIGADLQYVFDLPSDVPHALVDVAVTEPRGASITATPAAQPVATPAGRTWYRFEDPSARSIAVRVKAPAPSTLVGDGYFAADVTPSLGGGSSQAGADAALFLVDTSLSSNPDRFNVWLRLLGAVLRNNRDTIKRFNVELFGIDQRFVMPSFVDNDEEHVAAALTELNAVALEGATDLDAALRRAAAAPGTTPRYDVFLLSDGASTWGEADPFVTTRQVGSGRIASLFAYRTGLAGTDVSTLSLLARELGGAVFSVNGDAEVDAASRAHRAHPVRLVEARVDGGSDVLLAGRPQFVFPGQTLHVAGRGQPAAGAELQLVLDDAGQRRTVRVPLGASLASPLAARAYGQIAVGQMEELAPATDEIATRYARTFRVPGKTASLLMLESEADYRRFGIGDEKEDAPVVARTPAAALIEASLARLAGALGDPKHAFRAWLADLPKQSGVELRLPEGFASALDRMPTSSFAVVAPPLVVRDASRARIPAPWLAELASHRLDYDDASVEAERRLRTLGPGDALKALSSMVEESPGDAVLARDVGMSAMLWGLPADAYHLFRRVAAARPFEPPTYRAEAQALARLGKIDLAMAMFEVGLAGQWDGRFGDFHQILAVEYRELLRHVTAGELATSVPDYAKQRFAALGSEVSVHSADLVVMITWNTDGTDVDLHVIEPTGEECMYSHRSTAIGGQLTRDVTQGYGPEMYVLPHAKEGTYQIRAHYFASDRNRASARTKVQALVFEDFGTPRQRVTEKTIVLETGKQVHDLFQIVRGRSVKGAQVAR
jgi:hypothetical protein